MRIDPCPVCHEVFCREPHDPETQRLWATLQQQLLKAGGTRAVILSDLEALKFWFANCPGADPEGKLVERFPHLLSVVDQVLKDAGVPAPERMLAASSSAHGR